MIIKEKLQLKRIELLLTNAARKGNILPFDDAFYGQLRNYYHGSMPANVFIKFFKPSSGMQGLCYERSLIISSIFNDCKLVRGDRLDYRIYHGNEDSFHWWVEADDWCYDPTSLHKY